jgi:hypothetical protein
LQDWFVTPGMMLELTGQTFLSMNRTEAIEVYQNIAFRKHSTDLSVGTDISKHVGVQSTYSVGARPNYYPAAGISPFLANSRDASVKMTFRPSSRFRFEQTYLLSRLRSRTGGPVIFDDHILRSTVRYQFSKQLSLRVIGEYDAVLPNIGLVNLTNSKVFTGDVLLTYFLTPGTAMYVGYTDQRQNLALLQGMPPTLATIGDPSTVTGRQIFMKISYAFRY